MVDDFCSARGEPGPINTMAVRLLISLLPGVESSVFFRDNEEVVETLYDWAERQPRESDLRAYAIGALGSAMQAELSINFRDKNQRIATSVLEELFHLLALNPTTPPPGAKRGAIENTADEPTSKRQRLQLELPQENGQLSRDNTDAEILSNINLILGDMTYYPVTSKVRQRLYLQFLAPVAQYQDLLAVMTKHNAVSLVLNYLDMKRIGDARLTFEALCLLASLLCHRKLATEFIQQSHSVSLLLSSVPRTTLPAAGVALCLYYLSYFEHTANRLCTSLTRPVLLQLMKYSLGLVQSGYVSSRNHAALFLAAMLPYNQVLEAFDSCNGISYLYNSLSTLAIFHANPDEPPDFSRPPTMNERGEPYVIDLAELMNEVRERQQARQEQPQNGEEAGGMLKFGS